MEDGGFFRQKGAGVARGAEQQAVDANPSEQSGFAAPVQVPIWKSFVDNRQFQEANKEGIDMEQQLLRESSRPERQQKAPTWDAKDGRITSSFGDDLDAEQFVDHPEFGGLARKSLFDRELKSARRDAIGAGVELSNPTLKARELTPKQREEILMAGSGLAETDPKHFELKARLVADDEVRAQRQELERKRYDAKVRAQELASMDADTWWQTRQMTSQRPDPVAGAVAEKTEAEKAHAAAQEERKALFMEAAGGANADRMAQIQARVREIDGASEVIADARVGAENTIKSAQDQAKQEERGFIENTWTALKRGFAGAAQGANVLQGATDATNAQDIVEYEKMKQANPASKEFQDFMKSEDTWESAKLFASSPIRIVSEVLAESAAQMIPGIALGFAGGAAGGAMASAPTGGAAAPATVPVGAVVGSAIGAGSGSALSEYASSMIQSMQEAGMDATDAKSVQKFFSDPEKLAKAREFAIKRGVAVGAFDALSAGLAGKFMKPVQTAFKAGEKVAAGRVLGATAKEVGLQAGAGATGEAAGQLASEGTISDGKSIFLEGIAEIGSAPFEVAGNLREFRKPDSVAMAVNQINTSIRAINPEHAQATPEEISLATPLSVTNTPESVARGVLIEREIAGTDDAQKNFVHAVVKLAGGANPLGGLTPDELGSLGLDAELNPIVSDPLVYGHQTTGELIIKDTALDAVAQISPTARKSVNLTEGQRLKQINERNAQSEWDVETADGGVQRVKAASADEAMRAVAGSGVRVSGVLPTRVEQPNVQDNQDQTTAPQVQVPPVSTGTATSASPGTSGGSTPGTGAVQAQGEGAVTQGEEVLYSDEMLVNPVPARVLEVDQNGKAKKVAVMMSGGEIEISISGPRQSVVKKTSAAPGVDQTPAAPAVDVNQTPPPAQQAPSSDTNAKQPAAPAYQDVSIEGVELYPQTTPPPQQPEVRAHIKKRIAEIGAKEVGDEAIINKEGDIEVNFEELSQSVERMLLPTNKAIEYINRVIDHEIYHTAQIKAMDSIYEKSGGFEANGDFNAWREAYSRKIWEKDFSGKNKAKGDTVRAGYVASVENGEEVWDSMSYWAKFAEATRMMKEGKKTTEGAFLWANISDTLYEVLSNVLKNLMTARKGLSKELKETLIEFRKALNESRKTTPQPTKEKGTQAPAGKGNEQAPGGQGARKFEKGQSIEFNADGQTLKGRIAAVSGDKLLVESVPGEFSYPRRMVDVEDVVSTKEPTAVQPTPAVEAEAPKATAKEPTAPQPITSETPYDDLVRATYAGQEARRNFGDLAPIQQKYAKDFHSSGLPRNKKSVTQWLKSVGVVGNVGGDVDSILKNLPIVDAIEAEKMAIRELNRRESAKKSTPKPTKPKSNAKKPDTQANAIPSEQGVTPDAQAEEQVQGGIEATLTPAEELARKVIEGLFAAKAPVARDAEYLAAVERGDMETAQRMVDEAAKDAGLVKLTMSKDSVPSAFYKPTTHRLDSIRMTEDATRKEDQGSWSRFLEELDGLPTRLVEPIVTIEYEDEPGAFYVEDGNHRVRAWQNELKLAGDTPIEALTFFDELDPVIYDEDGKIIPPSERFRQSDTLRATTPPTAQSYNTKIPRDRFKLLTEAADSLVQEGVNTPEKLTETMKRLAPDNKAVQFTQSFWFAMKSVGIEGVAEPDWGVIYNPNVDPIEEVKAPVAETKAAKSTAKRSATDAKKLKAQKEYLLAALDKAIEEAPDERIQAFKMTDAGIRDLSAAEQSVSNLRRGAFKPESESNLRSIFERYGVAVGGSITSQQNFDRLTSAIRSQSYIAPEGSKIIEISVPGDGTFRIVNDKKTLQDFRKKANTRFPTSSASDGLPRLTTPRETAITKTGSPKTNKDFIEIASIFVSDDPQREILHNVHSDGTNIVATNGSILIAIDKNAGGTEEKPIHFNGKTIKPVKDATYPGWKQVVSTIEVKSSDEVNTAELQKIAIQAKSVAAKRDLSSPEGQRLIVWRDDAGNLGYSLENTSEKTESGAFAGGNADPETAKIVTALNVHLVLDALKGMRMLGHEKIKMNFGDSPQSPVMLSADGVKIVISPTKTADVKAHPMSDAWGQDVSDAIESEKTAVEQEGNKAEESKPTEKSSIDVSAEQYRDRLSRIKLFGGASYGSLTDSVRQAVYLGYEPDQAYQDLIDAGVTLVRAGNAVEDVVKDWKMPTAKEEPKQQEQPTKPRATLGKSKVGPFDRFGYGDIFVDGDGVRWVLGGGEKWTLYKEGETNQADYTKPHPKIVGVDGANELRAIINRMADEEVVEQPKPSHPIIDANNGLRYQLGRYAEYPGGLNEDRVSGAVRDAASSLMGDRNAEARQSALEFLVGAKPSKAKAGINILDVALGAWLKKNQWLIEEVSNKPTPPDGGGKQPTTKGIPPLTEAQSKTIEFAEKAAANQRASKGDFNIGFSVHRLPGDQIAYLVKNKGWMADTTVVGKIMPDGKHEMSTKEEGADIIERIAEYENEVRMEMDAKMSEVAKKAKQEEYSRLYRVLGVIYTRNKDGKWVEYGSNRIIGRSKADKYALFQLNMPSISTLEVVAKTDGDTITFVDKSREKEYDEDVAERKKEKERESSISRSKPRQTVTFKSPVKTPLGEVLQYSWSSQLIEDVDNRGEPVLRRVSDWEEAATNAETGRDIVHKFQVRKPDGTVSEVSLESTLGSMSPDERKSMKSVLSAARRLPFMKSELAELEAKEKESKADYERVSNLSPDLKKIELREPEFAFKEGEKDAYLDGVYLGRVSSDFLLEDGRINPRSYGAQQFEAQAELKWRDAQRKISLRPSEIDRMDSLRRRIKKAEATLKDQGASAGSVSAESQPKTEESSKITDFGEKIGGARKDLVTKSGEPAKPRKTNEKPGWFNRYEVNEVVANSKPSGPLESYYRRTGESGESEVGRFVINDKRKTDWKGNPIRATRETFATREEAEKNIPIIEVGRNHRVRKGANLKYGIWRKITDRKIVQVVQQEFETEKDALKYMVDNAEDIIETKTSWREELIAKPENAVRKGPERRSGPATPEMFQSAFGFRGVEFGNWMRQVGEGKERQEVLNHAYDGLLDLADVLGIPAKAISLNGELGLAFGARGQGLSGAKAHYEPSYVVINLTKMSGAGSLAHEWIHALDHYFGRQDGRASIEWVKNKLGDSVLKTKDVESDFVSHGFSSKSNVREQVRTAFMGVMDSIFNKAVEYVEDSNKAEDFVAKSREELERKIAELRKIVTAGPSEYRKRQKAANEAQLAVFDTAADLLISGQDVKTEWREIPGSKARFGTRRWTNDSLEKLGEIYKATVGRSGFTPDRGGYLDSIQGAVSRYEKRIKMLESAAASETKTKKVPTEFSMNARRIDEGSVSAYWNTPHEMLARAFSAYVEDKIAESGGTSDFLSYGSDNTLPKYRMFNVKPFPEGEERKSINQAFSRLFDEIEANETEKGVELRATQPPTAAPNYARHAELEAKHNAGTITDAEVEEARRIVEVAAKRAGAITENEWKLTDRSMTSISLQPQQEGRLTRKDTGANWASTQARKPGETDAGSMSALPIKFFHGTDSESEFTEFDPSMIGKNWRPELGAGFYFSPNLRFAASFGRKKIMETFLFMRNPLAWEVANGSEALDFMRGLRLSDPKSIQNKAKSFGYDGIITGDGQAVVFDPSQIKSADPFTGVPLKDRFNPESPSILRAATPPRATADFEKTKEFYKKLKEQEAVFPGSSGVDPRYANPGATPEARQMGDIARVIDETRKTIRKDADTFQAARDLLKRDEAGIESMLFSFYTDAPIMMNDAEMVAADLLINKRVEDANGNSAKLENAMKLYNARILSRRENARALRIGYDKFMKPAEREAAKIVDSIFTLPKSVEKRGAMLSPTERKAFMERESRQRLEKVTSELAKMGVKLKDITAKNRTLTSENAKIMRDALAQRNLFEQRVIRMVQRGASIAEIRQYLGNEMADKAQGILNKFREDLEAKIVKLLRAGKTRDEIRELLAKDGLKAAATPGGTSLTDEQVLSIAREILESDFALPKEIHEKPLPRVKKPKKLDVESTPDPRNSNWSRPIFDDGLRSFTFDTKDRVNIMAQVEYLRSLVGAVGKISELSPDKRKIAEGYLEKIDAILAKYGKDTQDVLAKGIHMESFKFDINDVAQVAALARTISALDADFVDKASEYLYGSMLSGLQTMLVNATAIVPATFEATVGRGFEMAINSFVNDPMSASLGEVKYIIRGLGPALTRAASNFVAAWKSQHPVSDRDLTATDVDWEKMIGTGGHRMVGSIRGKFGDIVRIPLRLLAATDDFNRTLIASAEVGAFAYRLAKAQGMKDGSEAMERFIKEEVNMPGSMSWHLATQKAGKMIFANPLPGQQDPHKIKRTEGGVRFGDKVEVRDIGDSIGYLAGRLTDAVAADHDNIVAKTLSAMLRISFFPFQRTPFNIIRKGVRYTLNPISIADIGIRFVQEARTPDGKWQWSKGFRNAEIIERVGQQLQGAIIMAALIAMAGGEGDEDDMDKAVLITGSQPFGVETQAEREARLRAGVGPYRFSVKVGDQRYGFSYGRFEPMATTLAATVDTIQAFKKKMRAGEDVTTAAMAISGSLLAQANDKTFMKGFAEFNDLLKSIITEPDVEKNRRLKQFMASKAAMAMPNFIKQPIRESDPYFRDKAQTFTENLLYEVAPYGIKPEKIDPYGKAAEKMSSAPVRIVDVFDIGGQDVNKYDEMLVRWADSGKGKPWYPSPIKTVTIKNPRTGKETDITPEQIQEFKKKAGALVTARLKTRNFNFKNPTQADIDFIRDTHEKARAAAKKALEFRLAK